MMTEYTPCARQGCPAVLTPKIAQRFTHCTRVCEGLDKEYQAALRRLEGAELFGRDVTKALAIVERLDALTELIGLSDLDRARRSGAPA
jgi:hypothetical protein